MGIDLGATWLRAALADERGRLLFKRVERTEPSQEGLEQQLVHIVRALLSEAGLRRPGAIGVGAIGPLDVRTGEILNPPNLPVERVRVAEVLEGAFDVPVYVLNDCTAACYGGAIFGAGEGLDNLAFLAIGTGIGGGAIVDGHLLIGRRGNAVEVGHLVVDARGALRCGCGGRGHWEAYCSGAGIPRFFRWWAARKGLDKRELAGITGKPLQELTAKDVLELCTSKPELLGAFLDELAMLNAAGLANLINIFEPELISVGGSVALANFELLIGRAKRFLALYAYNEVPEIIPSPLGGEAVLLGAIALALRPPESLK